MMRPEEFNCDKKAEELVLNLLEDLTGTKPDTDTVIADIVSDSLELQRWIVELEFDCETCLDDEFPERQEEFSLSDEEVQAAITVADLIRLVAAKMQHILANTISDN